MAGGTLGTDFRVAAVFTVSIPVGGAVGQDVVFRADHAVIIFIIDVRPPGMSAFHRHGPLVGSRQYPAIPEYLFADMRGLVGSVRHHCLNLWKRLNQFVVNIVKRHAVMDISGGDHCFQYVTVLVAGGMGLISEAPLVLPFVEHSTLRVCGGYRYGFLLFCRFLPPGPLLF